MVEQQLASLSLQEDTPKNEIVREFLLGHKKSVNSIQHMLPSTNLPECLLSASDDGTARIWDLRINKGVMLLNHTSQSQEVICAKMINYNGLSHLTVTATGQSLNFFDMRKPSLIIK